MHYPCDRFVSFYLGPFPQKSHLIQKPQKSDHNQNHFPLLVKKLLDLHLDAAIAIHNHLAPEGRKVSASTEKNVLTRLYEIVGDAGLLVEVCNPLSSKYTAPLTL